jgi:hypothetical protein
MLFLREGSDAVGNGDERNNNHRCVRMGWMAQDMVFVPYRRSSGMEG